MIEATCHCGAVRLEIAMPPVEVTRCHCTICRKRGTLWAYYAPSEVRFIGEPDATSIYLWGEKRLEFHTCRICGCSTHWAAVDKTLNRLGVNARLMERDVLAAARVREIEGPG